MDTNMSQALKMAGGILIALVIISTVAFFFKSLIPVQKQIDQIEELEQTAEFNKQYEVYNKSLMLGIDIISVINKAYSNNRAYIEAYGYSDDLRNNYLIDVELIAADGSSIKLAQILDIKLTTWDIDGKVKEISIDVDDLEDGSKDQLELNIGEEPRDVWPIRELTNGISLIDTSADNTNDTIYNTIISNTELKKIFNNNDNNTKDDWTKAIFETYAYSLKTKKFTCDSVVNSPQTGRIISMTFSEIQ